MSEGSDDLLSFREKYLFGKIPCNFFCATCCNQLHSCLIQNSDFSDFFQSTNLRQERVRKEATKRLGFTHIFSTDFHMWTLELKESRSRNKSPIFQGPVAQVSSLTSPLMYKLDESFHMLHMASSPQSIFGWGNEKSQDSRFCIFFAFKNKGRFFIRHSILIQINAYPVLEGSKREMWQKTSTHIWWWNCRFPPPYVAQKKFPYISTGWKK